MPGIEGVGEVVLWELPPCPGPSPTEWALYEAAFGEWTAADLLMDVCVKDAIVETYEEMAAGERVFFAAQLAAGRPIDAWQPMWERP